MGSFKDVEKLESFIVEKMAESHMAGLSISLVKGGDVVYSRGFGFRDLESGRPATPGTIYGIGSVTKSFTALSILQLVEEGKLSLEDPVEKYVNIPLRVKGEPVTIHNLMTHSSGIPALAYAEAFIRGMLETGKTWLPLASPHDIIAFMRGYEGWTVAKPGERFFYLNEGYVLLGLIISKVSGVRYEEYVRERILRPLGMERTYWTKEEVDRDPDVATPYVVDKDGRHIASRFPYGVTSDGGLLSNTLDLSRYVSMYLGRGEVRGVRILGRKLIELMEKPHIRVGYELLGEESYGYGLGVYPNFLGRRLIGHSGSVLVYTAFIGYLPEDGLGVAVLANSSGYPLSHIGMYALALMLGRDPDSELPFIRSERILSRLQGVYETFKGTMRLTVSRRGDFLYVEYKDKYVETSTPLVPEEVEENYAKFYTYVGGRKVSAEFHMDGERVEMLYERYKLVKKEPL